MGRRWAALALVAQAASAASSVVVIVPGANRSFSREQYLDLASAVEARSIRTVVADVPDTSPSAVAAAITAAVSGEDGALFVAAHSDAGETAEALAYGNATFGGRGVAGLVLLGSYVPRAHYARPVPNGTTPPSTTGYPTRVLTVCGSLDGLARVTRCGAEAFFRQAGTDDPVVVVEGLSHAQFADGHASSADVLARDLAPELSQGDATAAIADLVAGFSRGETADVASTAAFVAPLVAGMVEEGSRALRDPCQSDYPTNPTCAYPQWPDASLLPRAGPPDPVPPADCACGSPWVAGRAQAIMSGFASSGLANASATTKDAFQDVSDVRPFHLPHIFNACGNESLDCVLETSTVSMPVYSLRQDSAVAVSEYRTKLKSRQAMWQAYGLGAGDVNATDATGLDTCAAINAASIAWARAAAAPDALERFDRAGTPLLVDHDREAPIGATGPTWIKKPLRYTRNASGVYVGSWSFTISNINRGDVPFFITAGYRELPPSPPRAPRADAAPRPRRLLQAALALQGPRMDLRRRPPAPVPRGRGRLRSVPREGGPLPPLLLEQLLLARLPVLHRRRRVEPVRRLPVRVPRAALQLRLRLVRRGILYLLGTRWALLNKRLI